MNIETFSSVFRLTFAGALYDKLAQPRVFRYCPDHSDSHRGLADSRVFIQIKGRLLLREHGETGETTVGISLLVPPEWMAFLPIVSTDAPFLRKELDWHVPFENVLCYSQNAEWSWKLAELWEKEADADEILEFASCWCIRNIDSLITRHLHGHRHGITKWPKQWGEWAHGKKGIRECELFIQSQKAA